MSRFYVVLMVVVLAGCGDKAKPSYDLCVAAEANGNVLGAAAACEAAVKASATSPSGKAAAEKLTAMQPAVAKAKADKDDADKLATMSPSEAADFGLNLYDTNKKPEEARAIPFFERACKGGEPRGCMGLGTAFFDGEGVVKDYARALELLDPACGKGVLRACRKVASLYYFGWGTKKDTERARSLWQQACDGGEMRGCSMLGTMYTASDAPPELHDMKLGLAMYKKACDGGYKDACDQAGKIQAAAATKAAAADAHRKVEKSYYGHDRDGECIDKGLPPYRCDLEGGSRAEIDLVAADYGCQHLLPGRDDFMLFKVFCCPN